MQRELRGLLHVCGPIRLRVVIRMRCLKATRSRPARRQARRRDRRRRAPQRARPRRSPVRVSGRSIAACPLSGVGDRTAARETPGTGHRDRAVDAARAGGCGDHDAALRRVEGVGHLRQDPMGMGRAGDRGVGRELAARNRCHAAVQRAVATRRPEVGDAAPVAPQRTAAQLRRWRRGIGERGGTIRAGHRARPASAFVASRCSCSAVLTTVSRASRAASSAASTRQGQRRRRGDQARARRGRVGMRKLAHVGHLRLPGVPAP